jgi:tRNA-splicing ligase RtcB (3'-phosphate/5'-hydroxy nucleic acid ligase)
MKVIDTERIPIKIWSELEKVDANAIEQLKNTARMPFVFKHVAAMPDVHLGIGATVGSVIATKKAIMPAAVGVDIGCGMMAVKTGLDYRLVQDKIKEIRHSIERSIPVGFSQHKNKTAVGLDFPGWSTIESLKGYDLDLKQKAKMQMGTLGGGNHFIEICLDTENNVWVMLHSGSRGVGNKVAVRHMNEAKDLMKNMFINLPDPDLAYFIQDTKEFQLYIADLKWCQEYAMQNRVEMMNLVMKDLSYAVNNGHPITRVMEVNCHHNYTEQENHYNENVWVTRKGAVRARVDDLGIIPGSMGAKSFIVRGLGNHESFQSCSHGAGRKMSRTQATKTFTKDDLAKQTEGVECRKDAGVVDEIPAAYKDIDEVMNNQKDLVEIVAQLKQILCVKG